MPNVKAPVEVSDGKPWQVVVQLQVKYFVNYSLIISGTTAPNGKILPLLVSFMSLKEQSSLSSTTTRKNY